jgi:transposase
VALLAAIFRGPDRARARCAEWTLPALCRWIEGRFDKRPHPASLPRIVRRRDLPRQKTRPRHPQADEKAKAAVAKGGSRAPWERWRSPIRTSASSRGSRVGCAWG